MTTLTVIFMEILRIIFAGCMALLVSMPMCVCGGTSLLGTVAEENFCCSGQHHDDQSPENSHDSDLSFDQLEYISGLSEIALPQSSETIVNNDTSFHQNEISLLLTRAGPYFRAPPPELFGSSGRRTSYCVYRL